MHGTVGLKCQRVNSQYSFVLKIKSARKNETCGVEYFSYAYQPVFPLVSGFGMQIVYLGGVRGKGERGLGIQ